MRSMTDEGNVVAAAAVSCHKALIRPALPGTFSRKGREKGARPAFVDFFTHAFVGTSGANRRAHYPTVPSCCGNTGNCS